MKKLDFILLVALMALWGFNFSVIKLGVLNINPLILTAMRFTFAVFPMIFLVKKPDVQWRYLIAYGLSFGVGVWGLATLSVYAGTSAGMASLLLDMSVVGSMLVGFVFLRERITWAKLAGSGLALSGLMLIISANGGAVTPAGLGLILSASAFWAVNGLIVKRANTTSIFAFNVWAMMFAPVPLLLLATAIHGVDVLLTLPQQINAWALFSALFQAYPTTLLGYWFWNKMMLRYTVSSVAPMTLLVPVFGLSGGYLFYDEHMTLAQVIAAVLILAGLVIGEMHGLLSKWFKLQQPETLIKAIK